MTVYGYLRVSTEEQARTGYGLDAQRTALAREALSRGVEMELITDEGISTKVPPADRPGFGPLLRALGKGDLLVIAKLDRIARSQLDFATLLALALKDGWQLVALDLGVDMSTHTGRLVAQIMMAVAEWEREVIGARTREALAEAKAQGTRLGRPRLTPDSVIAAVLAAREQGDSYATIATQLNLEQVPTAHGGKCWYPASVRNLVRSAALDEEAA